MPAHAAERLRAPRPGHGPGAAPAPALETLPLGKGELRRKGLGTALLAFGSLLAPALEAAEALNATVANMRFVKPLDEELIQCLAAEHELLVTLEENVVAGGAGSAVGEWLNSRGMRTRLLQLGLPDRFIEQASPARQLADCGLDAAGIERSVRAAMQGA